MAVYLDHNATTPLDARVLAAMLPYLGAHYGNPSSAHSIGRKAYAAVDHARAQIAQLVNASPTQVVFTSGGTEANNLAIKGALANQQAGRITLSAIEHASVRGPVQALVKQGWVADEIGVDDQGKVLPAAVQQALHSATRLVSVMMANNETGVVQDIAVISGIARCSGAVFHTDAIQALGKMRVDFRASGAHLMSLSAHKINGPKGIGALVVDKSVPLEPLLHGGGHEQGRRAGTENVAAIVGFGAAAELARTDLDKRQARWSELRTYLENGLHTLPGLVIFAEQAERLLNTVLVSAPELAGETLIENLDQAGIIVSSGSACASGNLAPSHVLLAMGVEPTLLRSVLRISLGQDTQRADIDRLMGVLSELLQRHTPWAKSAAHA